MPATDKDTIYVDVDDEITGIIDKLNVSKGKVVALVLPKRAGVFQSIVNMKLLQRAADNAKKNVVLITTEAGLLPLAGAAGIHVAKTLTSKPEIPSAPAAFDEAVETVNESDGLDEPQISPDQTVGELAGLAPPIDEGVETIALDDAELPPEDETDKPAAKEEKTPKKPKKNKKLKIPNFERFRLILIIFVVVLIIVVILFLLLNSGLAKATIDIKTDASNIDTSQNITLSTSTSSDDSSSGSTIPAKLAQEPKTYSQQETTTGQENNGSKASGTITVSAGSCSGSVPADIPAGTGATANNQTYIIEDDISFSPQLSNHNTSCQFVGTDSSNPSNQGNIPVIAQSGGSSYNVSGVPFTIAGYSSYTANGSASGGTDDIVQTVNQNDINNAKAKINTTDSTAEQYLENELKGDGYTPIQATYTTGTPTVTSSAAVGAVANTVTVTEVVTYTMFGAQQSALTSLVDSNINSQINTSKQSILDNGLSSANYAVNSQTSNSASLTLTATAVVGPELDNSAILSAAAGQKAGIIESQLNSNPDVTGVTVHFSPFWVSTAPKNTKHITINIAKPTTTKSSTSNGSGN